MSFRGSLPLMRAGSTLSGSHLRAPLSHAPGEEPGPSVLILVCLEAGGGTLGMDMTTRWRSRSHGKRRACKGATVSRSPSPAAATAGPPPRASRGTLSLPPAGFGAPAPRPPFASRSEMLASLNGVRERFRFAAAHLDRDGSLGHDAVQATSLSANAALGCSSCNRRHRARGNSRWLWSAHVSTA